MDDSLTEEQMHELVCCTPVSQVGNEDLGWMIRNWTEMMIEGSGESADLSGDRLEEIHLGSRTLFMRNAVNHPDSSVEGIIKMCIEQSMEHSKNVALLNKCVDLKPARNTKGFGNS